MEKMNERLAKIANKRAQLDALASAEQMKKVQTIAYYANKLKMLAPRIKDLMEIANSLVENDIPLGQTTTELGMKYKDAFVAEGIHHRLGFFFERLNGENYLVGIGIEGGGCCGHDLVVNDDGYMEKHPDYNYASYQYTGYWDYCDKCKRFLNEFDDFERRVYAYVDNL